MWHCPHCGTPQAETARCWVCRRSSTTCSTCRHFRASLAAEVGYCALDRHRRPLTGLELRACWEESIPSAGDTAVRATTEHGLESDRRLARRRPGVAINAGDDDRGPARDFVPIEDLERVPMTEAPVPPEATGPSSTIVPGPTPAPFLLADPIDRWEERTSLFGEPER